MIEIKTGVDKELKKQLLCEKYKELFLEDSDAVISDGVIVYTEIHPKLDVDVLESVTWISHLIDFGEKPNGMYLQMFACMGYELKVHPDGDGEITITVTNIQTLDIYRMRTSIDTLDYLWGVVYNAIGQDLVSNTRAGDVS